MGRSHHSSVSTTLEVTLIDLLQIIGDCSIREYCDILLNLHVLCC